MAVTLFQYRSRFSRTIECAAKQIGLRRVGEALALGDRNPVRVAEVFAELPNLLAVAEERSRRTKEGRS